MGVTDSKIEAVQAHWQAVESENPELAEILHDYKVATIMDIDEAFQNFVLDNGCDEMLVDMVTFEDTFDPVVSDSMMHYEFWTKFHGARETHGVASPFAVFAALYLFGDKLANDGSNVSTDAKLAMILKMFDFNRTGLFNLAECQSCFEVVATMVCNLVEEMGETIVPDVTTLCQRLRHDLGLDDEETEITLAVLNNWLATQDDVCRFLACITDIRLIQTDMKRVEVGISHAADLFLERATVDDKHITNLQFIEILSLLPGARPSDEEQTLFAEIVDSGDIPDANGGSGGGSGGSVSVTKKDNKIYIDEFINAMMPWVAFAVLDVDESGTIDSGELKALLWISRGVDSPEPSKSAVERAMGMIDDSGNGLVERLEWIRYCSQCDMKTGGESFSSTAKFMWDKMDEDGSHNITHVEIANFFREGVVTIALAKSPAKLQSEQFMNQMNVICKNAADAAMSEMDSNHDGKVEWSGFQRFHDTMLEQKKHLEQYVEVLIASGDELERDRASAAEAPTGNFAHATFKNGQLRTAR